MDRIAATLPRIIQGRAKREMLTRNLYEWAGAAVKVIREKLAEHLVESNSRPNLNKTLPYHQRDGSVIVHLIQ